MRGIRAINVWHIYAAVLIAATVFSGPMLVGYAVFDEIAVYAVLAMTVGVWLRGCAIGWLNGIGRVHQIVFLIFLAYLGLETLRGIVALGDIRIVRFTAMFIAIAAIACFLPAKVDLKERRQDLAHVVTIAVALYFAAYVAAGLVGEVGFGIDRFDLQGLAWSGTTTAVFPIYIGMTALVIVGREMRKTALFWIAFCMMVVACAYYDSRSMRAALLVFIALAFFSMHWRRAVAMAAIYLVLLVYFPWTTENMVTKANLRDYAQSFTKVNLQMVRFRTWNYVEGMFPGVFPIILAELKGGQKSEVDPMLHRAYRVYDFDRKLAIVGAVRFVTSDGWPRLLFGTGYYTHRYELIPAFQAVAADNDYKFPPGYLNIVRTATFNGMLADNGLVGMGLLAALFALSGLTIITSRPGYRLLSLSALGLIVISLLSSAQYDLMLFYLALMPGGPLLAYHYRSRSAATRADV